jgi:hypothetical protein
MDKLVGLELWLITPRGKRGGIVKGLIRLAFWVIIIAIAWQAITKDPQGAKATVAAVFDAFGQFVGWLIHR